MSEQEPVTNSGSKKQSESSFFWNFSSEGWDRIAVWAMLAALILFVVNVVDYFDFWPSYWYSREGGELRDLGNFGDFLGGVLTPLLTFLTFVGLLQSIHLQREELKATRDELAASARAQEEQVKYMEKQQKSFEAKETHDRFWGLFNKLNEFRLNYKRTVCGNLQYNRYYNVSHEFIINEFEILFNHFEINCETYLHKRYFNVKERITVGQSLIDIEYRMMVSDYIIDINYQVFIIVCIINELILKFDYDLSVDSFLMPKEISMLRKYYSAAKANPSICSATTKAHLEKIVTFLDEQDRLTHPTP